MKTRKIIFVFGWVLVSYCILINLIGLIGLCVPKQSASFAIVISAFRVLHQQSPPLWQLIIISLSRLIFGSISLIGLIGGIAVIRFKEWGRKLIVWVFSLGLVSFCIEYILGTFHPFFWDSYIETVAGVIFEIALLTFYFTTVFFLTRPEIKKEFKNTGHVVRK